MELRDEMVEASADRMTSCDSESPTQTNSTQEQRRFFVNSISLSTASFNHSIHLVQDKCLSQINLQSQTLPTKSKAKGFLSGTSLQWKSITNSPTESISMYQSSP